MENNHLTTENDTEPAVVLRILNGIMRGAEFSLPRGNTLFVSGSPAAFGSENRTPAFPENAVFVPLDTDAEAFNFEVIVVAEDQVTLRALHETQVQEQACPLNTVITLGGLEFSVKPHTADWDIAVLSHPTALSPVTDPMPKPRGVRMRRVIIAGSVLAMLIAALGTAYWVHGSTQREQIRLADLLHGSIGGYQVIKGNDEVFYVFADTPRDATWAKQALVRSNYDVPVKVIYSAEEKGRIEKFLDSDNSLSAYHILRLDNPASPELLTSAERGPRNQLERDRMVQLVKAQLPYASQVRITPVADAAVALNAQRGLDKLGIAYKRLDNATSVTFEVQNILDDSELQKLRSYVDAFYQRWGSHYIHFVVDLKDDWLKGKSFGYGMDNYVKLSNSHWYFPRPSN